jgi:hypothetical protein
MASLSRSSFKSPQCDLYDSVLLLHVQVRWPLDVKMTQLQKSGPNTPVQRLQLGAESLPQTFGVMLGHSSSRADFRRFRKRFLLEAGARSHFSLESASILRISSTRAGCSLHLMCQWPPAAPADLTTRKPVPRSPRPIPRLGGNSDRTSTQYF